MKLLSIETSCDETAISILDVVETDNTATFTVLANVVRSQIDIHREFGGVYPNLAKREHAKNLPPIFVECLKQADMYHPSIQGSTLNTGPDEIRRLLEREGKMADVVLEIANTIERPALDAIVVTAGPGLAPALWVGINFAKALSLIWDIPVMPANHMHGHALSTLITATPNTPQTLDISNLRFPAISLLISGGHTELVVMNDFLACTKIGATKDDAVGEAFDKVARLLGLPYPGGPKVSELAKRGVTRADISLPRPMINSGDYSFSFSGIKTSVLYLVKKLGEMDEQTKCDVAREFETAVTDVLVKKTRDAVAEFGATTLIVGGGVSANTYIKERLTEMAGAEFPGTQVVFPDHDLSTDNSLMIAIAGFFLIRSGKAFPELATIVADPNWSL